MKNKRALKGPAFLPLFAVSVIFVVFVIVFVVNGLGDYKIYKNHSWIETEAKFVGSERYTDTKSRRKAGGGFSSVTVTRYRWEYSYEIDGTAHSFTIDGRKESAPEKDVRYIIAAEDDHSLYLKYKNGGALKAVLIFFPIFGVLIFALVLAAIFAFRKKLLQKAEE